MILVALLGAALAQEAPAPTPEAAALAPGPSAEPEAPEPPLVVGEEGPEVINIYGELLVQRARDEIVRDLRDLGFTEVIDKGDHVIYRHTSPWKGEVLLYDDGWMQSRRQPVRIEGREWKFAEKNSPAAWAMCIATPWRCLRLGGALVSKRKFLGQESKTVGAIHDEVEDWSDAIADASVERKVNDLPQRLELLWREGAPIDEGGAPALTAAARKQALLAYWESRTETEWGEKIRQAIESFARSEIQGGPDAFTPEEIAAFNLKTTANRPFTLEKRKTHRPVEALALPEDD